MHPRRAWKQPLAIGRLHWVVYRWAILALVAGVLLVWLEYTYLPHRDGLMKVTAWTFAIAFLVTFAYAWFWRWVTEFAVTNRRVISSRVFVARSIEEMSMEKSSR